MANGHGGKRSGAGRKQGQVNESTRIAKEAIELVFEELGGWRAMAAWARENQNDFYRLIYPKLLPVQLNHADNEGGRIELGWLGQQDGS
jgi:hypothetical protein